jgi:hypothetical protein
MRALGAAALILLWSSIVMAEQRCGLQDYDSIQQPDFDCPGPDELTLQVDLHAPPSVPIHEDDELIVPWEGALVHRDRLIEVGLTLRAVRRLRWADRVRLSEEFRVRLQYENSVAASRLLFAQQQRDVYRDRALAADQRTGSAQSWWRSPSLWFGIGVVVAGVLVALTGWALSAAAE